MATLLFKVGALTVRTIAKPLSSSIERLVMSNEGTRKVVVNVAQVLHRMDVWISRRAVGKEGRVFVGDMTEEKAVSLASRLISEGFIYSTAVSMVLWEGLKKTDDDRKKAAKAHQERLELQALLRHHDQVEGELLRGQVELTKVLARVEDRVQHLEKIVSDHEAQKNKKRWFGLA